MKAVLVGGNRKKKCLMDKEVEQIGEDEMQPQERQSEEMEGGQRKRKNKK